MIEISGTRPRSISWRRPSSAYHASEVTASWMRAPAESLMPMIGQPTIATHSISLATLRPNISPTEPWNTVWSWLNTPTGRPLIVPWPVTTPSPKSAFGITRRLAQRADLQEAARVEQRVDAGAGAGDALLLALGDGLLTAGLLGQLQLLAQFGQLLGGGGADSTGSTVTSPRCLLSLDAVDRLAHVRADLRNVRLVDRLDVLAPDRHHLEIGRRTHPSRRPACGWRSAART